MFNPVMLALATVEELRELVHGVGMLERALATPVDKDAMACRLDDTRAVLTRGVVARRDLRAGEVLAAGDLAPRGPLRGPPPERLPHLVGRPRLRAPTRWFPGRRAARRPKTGAPVTCPRCRPSSP